MLEDVQNTLSVSQRDKRGLAASCGSLAANATTEELLSWLATALTAKEMQHIHVKTINAAELLRVENEQEVASLLGLTVKAAVKVLAQLNELRDRAIKRVKPEPTYDNENVDMNGPIDRKPDLAQLDAEMPEEDENMRENANPQAHAADTEMQNVAQDEHFMHQQQADDGDDERREDEQQKAEDGAGEKDDEDGELADKYIQAVEDGGPVPDTAALPWCMLVKPDPVVLPDDISEAKLYAERALLGFVGLMDDLHPACMIDIAKQYGVADSGKSGQKVTKKQRGYTRNKQLCAVWKEVSEGLKQAFERVSDWKCRAEDRLTKLKRHLHKVLNTASVQNFPSTCRALRRHVPYDREVVGQERTELEEERENKNKKYRVLLDEHTLERAWALWQATPLIGCIDVPMHVRLPQNMNYLTKGSKTASTSRLPQYCWFGKMWDMATHEDNQLRLQAPTTGDKVAEAQALLHMMDKFCSIRYDSKWSQAGVLPFVWFDRREDLDVPGGLRGFNLHCKFFLEGAQATMDTSDGMSGFLQFNETQDSAQVVDLFRYCSEFQGTDLQARCNKYSDRFVDVAAQVSAVAEEKGRVDHDKMVSQAVEGKLFKELLGLVSDTDSAVPEGLKEDLKPLLTVEPTRYQLSSLGFVQREEASEEGLQRHYMWPVTLPHHPDVIAYLIPHCNALWWGSKEELLHPEEHAIGAGVCAMRKPRSIELTGDKSKGGLLGLEMGMGKTLVMIAAHVLEQHKLPEKPTMVTQLTEDQLQEFETVLVGKDPETARECDMFKGFKQLDDATGTIVPDGSLRFTGLGNLVIVPASIAPQWQQEIQKLCTQEQNVMVLDGLKDRRRFMTSKEGLEELASFDWVVTTPAKAVKDIDMLNAITWRRVIADEAHQIHASSGVVIPDVLEPGMTKKNQREMAFMDMLNRIPATEGHWCLTGTPLRDYRNVASMDRIFRFLNTGVRTQDLHNAGFVNFLMDIAIRFSKKGAVMIVDAEGNEKELRNIKLPPVYYKEETVPLNPADKTVLQMAKERLIINSTYSKEVILEKQELKHKRDNEDNIENAQEEDDDDEDDDDEDYEQPLTAEEKRMKVQQAKEARAAKRRNKVMQANDQDAEQKKKKDTMAVKMLTTIVDPLRKILSSAQDMYFDGTVDGPKQLEPSVETLHIGEPEALKAMKLRKQRGQEPPTPQEYAERRREIQEKREREYTAVSITSKVDKLISDVEKIMDDGPDEAGRPPKIIIYSNFQGAFKRIQLFLHTKNIRYASLVDTGMSMKKRAEAMEDFKENEENKSLGATGINLTVANHVLILEPSWNPVFEEQAISRAHRLGQTGPIKVIRYVAENTVDQYLRNLMLQAASEDDGVQEKLMDAVEQKGTFESDDKALNNTIGKIMDLPSLCCLIGDIDVSDDEESDDEGEEEEEEEPDQD